MPHWWLPGSRECFNKGCLKAVNTQENGRDGYKCARSSARSAGYNIWERTEERLCRDCKPKVIKLNLKKKKLLGLLFGSRLYKYIHVCLCVIGVQVGTLKFFSSCKFPCKSYYTI